LAAIHWERGVSPASLQITCHFAEKRYIRCGCRILRSVHGTSVIAIEAALEGPYWNPIRLGEAGVPSNAIPNSRAKKEAGAPYTPNRDVVPPIISFLYLFYKLDTILYYLALSLPILFRR
jgi:hypothetical protein